MDVAACNYCIPAMLIIILVNIAAVVRSDLTLTSNLTENRTAYDTQTVIFQCATRGTGKTFSWHSDAYIGSENLQFTHRSHSGAHRISPTNKNTVATLINITTDDDTGIIEFISELKITASQQYPNSFVICRLNGDGARSEILNFCKADQYC